MKNITILLICLCSFLVTNGISQSRKEQIELLTQKLDSANTACKQAIYTQEKEIKSLTEQVANINESNSILKSKLKSTIDSLRAIQIELAAYLESINKLKLEHNSLKEQISRRPHSYFDTEYGVSSYYAYNLLENQTVDGLEPYFQVNNQAIIQKEKKRIEKSKCSKRNQNKLEITSNSGMIILENNSEYEGMGQTFYSYLFEDLGKNKVFCVRTNITYAGGGGENNELIEVNLETGNIYTHTPEYMGGEFYFSAHNNWVVIAGWYSDGDGILPLSSKFCILNLESRNTELTILDSEIMNLTWLSDNSFRCQVIKYEKNREAPEPYFNRPENYLTPFTLFNNQNGKWVFKVEE